MIELYRIASRYCVQFESADFFQALRILDWRIEANCFAVAFAAAKSLAIEGSAFNTQPAASRLQKARVAAKRDWLIRAKMPIAAIEVLISHFGATSIVSVNVPILSISMQRTPPTFSSSAIEAGSCLHSPTTAGPRVTTRLLSRR